MESGRYTDHDPVTEGEPPTNEDGVWIELKRGTEGVSLAVYRIVKDHVSVVDETWWTWEEFTGIAATELPISTEGTTTLGAVPNSELLTADNILDTVASVSNRPDIQHVNFHEHVGIEAMVKDELATQSDTGKQ
jgi:hypothetical protein